MFLSKNTLTTFTDMWHRACDKGPSPNLNKVYFICTIRQTGEHIPQYLLYQHRLIQMKEWMFNGLIQKTKKSFCCQMNTNIPEGNILILKHVPTFTVVGAVLMGQHRLNITGLQRVICKRHCRNHLICWIKCHRHGCPGLNIIQLSIFWLQRRTLSQCWILWIRWTLSIWQTLRVWWTLIVWWTLTIRWALSERCWWGASPILNEVSPLPRVKRRQIMMSLCQSKMAPPPRHSRRCVGRTGTVPPSDHVSVPLIGAVSQHGVHNWGRRPVSVDRLEGLGTVALANHVPGPAHHLTEHVPLLLVVVDFQIQIAAQFYGLVKLEEIATTLLYGFHKWREELDRILFVHVSNCSVHLKQTNTVLVTHLIFNHQLLAATVTFKKPYKLTGKKTHPIKPTTFYQPENWQ